MVDVLAALLHLGSAQFKAESTEHGDEIAALADSACVDRAADLLGADRL